MVSYDPADPSYATLETGVSWFRVTLLPIGLAFFSFAALMLWWLIQKRPNQDNEAES